MMRVTPKPRSKTRNWRRRSRPSKENSSRSRDGAGNSIDYSKVVSGSLKLVPDADALKVLEADYKKMADDGILLDDAEPFSKLIERCADLEKRANAGK